MIGWEEGGLPWIPMALSTLRPATSPRLSSIRLNFAGSPIINKSIETLIEDMGNDLLRIVDEVARIDHEFEGAVNLTVVPDSKFEVVLKTLNVRFRLAVLSSPRGRVDPPPFAPCRFFSYTVSELGSAAAATLRLVSLRRENFVQ